MAEVNNNNEIIDFLLNKTIQSFDNSHYVSNNKINYYQFNKILQEDNFESINDIRIFNLNNEEGGNFYYNDDSNILSRANVGIEEYKEGETLYFRKYNKLKMTRISSKSNEITYSVFNTEEICVLTNVVPEFFNKNIEYEHWKNKDENLNKQLNEFVTPYKIQIELIDKNKNDNIFYDLYGPTYQNLNKSYFDNDNGVLYINDIGRLSTQALLNDSMEIYITFFQFAFNIYGYYPDNYAIRNIYINNKYDDHSINISRNITLGNDYNERESLEIHGNIHISKDSDLIHDNYRLNQIAYDNSDNFHLIDRQFMKIEDIILGYNSSIIKTKYEYFSCGNNEFGQMGLIYDNDALLTEFKKNVYLKYAKKISIGKENIGYIDDNKCLYVAGGNRYGQLGMNYRESKGTKEFIKITHCYNYTEGINDIDFKKIISGQNGFYLCDYDDKFYYCGFNTNKKQDIRSKYYPIITNVLMDSGGINIKNIFTSKYLIYDINYSCLYATDINNDVYGCGTNDWGQLGIGNYTDQKYFKKIKELSNIKKVSVGKQFAFFLSYDGNLYVSGRNIYGVFGIGDTDNNKYVLTPILVNTNVDNVDCGSNHVIIIKNFKVYSSGRNFEGQLGVGHSDNVNIFTEIVNLYSANFTDIKCASTWSSFFLDDEGNVYSCGLGNNMILGHGNSNTYTAPIKINNLTNIVKIDFDYNHSVVLDSSGDIYVCGRNEYGQLGLNNFITNYSIFTKVPDISNVIDIQASWLNTMILTNDNSVYVTGDNQYGQMGNNLTNDKYSIFTKITRAYKYEEINDVSDINLCDGRMTVLTTDNKMYSCGNNMNGYLGLGDNENKNILHEHINFFDNSNKITRLNRIKKINNTKSMTHNLFMDNSGNLFGIGSNIFGQMGLKHTEEIYIKKVNYFSIQDGNKNEKIDNSEMNIYYPVLLDISNVDEFGTGYNTTIILNHDKKVYCCGNSENNELGLYYRGTYNDFTLLMDITKHDIKDVNYMYNSDKTTFIINKDNDILVLGKNEYGQLGLKNTIDVDEFSNINNNINYQSISNSGNSFILLDNNNDIYVCGDNQYGQLGIKNKDKFLNKTKVTEFICHYGYLDIFFKYDTIYVTVRGGKMYGMGNNNNMLGLEQDYIYSPLYIKQISHDYNIEKCSVGKSHVMVLTTGNLIFVCGDNQYGQLGLGHNNNNNKYVFVDTIDNNKTIVDIECGEYFSVVLFDDNTVYVTGDNRNGQLGIGNQEIQSINIFTKIEIEHITKIGCGNNHLCLLDKDRDIYVCGDNQYGQLGLNDKINRYTITKISMMESIFYGLFEFKYRKDFNDMYVGFNTSFFKDNWGMYYSCGKNDYGQLGLNNTNEILYPEMITFDYLIQNIIIGNDYTYFHKQIKQYNNELAFNDIQNGIYDSNNVEKYLNDDNTIYVCGKNDIGQLGMGHNDDISGPIINTFFNGKSIFKIKCGMNNVYYIDKTNKMYSTGLNNYNILHHNNYNGNTLSNSNIFKEFINNQNTNNIIIQKILNTEKNSFLIDDEGYLYVCGLNNYKQLGLNDVSNIELFYQNENIRNVLNIVSDGDSTIITTSENKIFVCGKNDYGQLGINNNYIDVSLVSIEYINNNFGYKDIYIKHGYSYIVTNNNKIYSTGLNTYGQLNTLDNNNISQYAETNFSIYNDMSSNNIRLSLGKNHVLLVRFIDDISYNENGDISYNENGDIINNENGELFNTGEITNILYGCGSNEHRQILDTSENKYNNFMSMNIDNLNSGIFQIYASYDYNTILDNSGYLYGNGIDASLHSISNILNDVNNETDEGNTGINQQIDISLNKFKIFNEKLTTVKEIPLIKNIQVGYSTTIITDISNELYCFGYNENGQTTLGHDNYIGTITNINSYHDFKIKKIQMMNNTHTFILTMDNDLFMYGKNNENVFGSESLGELYINGLKLNNTVNYYNNIYTYNDLNIEKLYVNGIQYQSSDRRIKKNITDISSSLAYNLLTSIETKYYQYVDEKKGEDFVIGFIAQEVEKVLPVAVKTVKSIEKIYDKDLGYREIEIEMKKLDKTKIFAIHSDVIKKLTSDINNQNDELDNLEKMIESIENNII